MCKSEYVLTIEHLAHFNLPDLIRVQLREPGGEPFTRFSIPAIVEYGYELPVLRSDAQGQLRITKEMFLRAQQTPEDSQFRGDYSLNRFVRIRVLDRSQGRTRADQRVRSAWPLTRYERELYGTMRVLSAAYMPAGDLAPFVILVDLLRQPSIVELERVVSLV